VIWADSCAREPAAGEAGVISGPAFACQSIGMQLPHKGRTKRAAGPPRSVCTDCRARTRPAPGKDERRYEARGSS